MKEVKYMGYRWGDWVENACRGLGYASETSISRLTTSPGRSGRGDHSPDYEPDPVARRFDDAMHQIPPRQQYIIYCRFALQLSDVRMMQYNSDFTTEGKARWAVKKAMRKIREVL